MGVDLAMLGAAGQMIQTSGGFGGHLWAAACSGAARVTFHASTQLSSSGLFLPRRPIFQPPFRHVTGGDPSAAINARRK